MAMQLLIGLVLNSNGFAWFYGSRVSIEEM
jgi:hypothetical protein